MPTTSHIGGAGRLHLDCPSRCWSHCVRAYQISPTRASSCRCSNGRVTRSCQQLNPWTTRDLDFNKASNYVIYYCARPPSMLCWFYCQLMYTTMVTDKRKFSGSHMNWPTNFQGEKTAQHFGLYAEIDSSYQLLATTTPSDWTKACNTYSAHWKLLVFHPVKMWVCHMETNNVTYLKKVQT